MPFIFQNFALIGVAVAAINWMLIDRRLTAEPRPLDPEETARGRAILRVYFGGAMAFFVAVALLQWLGGFPDPLFAFYDPTGNVWSVTVWILVYTLWAVILIGLWRPGIADIAVRLGMYRGPRMSAQTFRLLMSAALVINACVFLALILGLWRIPRLGH